MAIPGAAMAYAQRDAAEDARLQREVDAGRFAGAVPQAPPTDVQPLQIPDGSAPAVAGGEPLTPLSPAKGAGGIMGSPVVARRVGAPQDPYGVNAAGDRLHDTQQRVEGGFGRVGEARQQLAESKATAAETAGAEMIAAAEAERARAEEEQRDWDNVQSNLAKWTDESAKLNEQLSKEKIDPSNYMSSKGAADRFMFILGGALGGLLSVQPGMDGRNRFVESVNAEIDRDIAAQEKNLTNRRASQQQRDTLVGQYAKIHGDKHLARLQTGETLNRAAMSHIEGVMKRATSDQERAVGQEMLAALQQNADQYREQIDQRSLAQAEDRAAQAKRERAAAAAAARAAEERRWKRGMELERLNLDKREADRKDRETDAKGKGELSERFVPTGPNGQGYLAPTKEEAKEDREKRESIADLQGTVRAIQDERKNLTFADRLLKPLGYQTDRIRSLDAMGAQATVKVNKAGGTGALDAGSLPLIQAQVGNASGTGLLTDPTARLRALDESLSRSLSNSESGHRGYASAMPGTVKRKD